MSPLPAELDHTACPTHLRGHVAYAELAFLLSVATQSRSCALSLAPSAMRLSSSAILIATAAFLASAMSGSQAIALNNCGRRGQQGV